MAEKFFRLFHDGIWHYGKAVQPRRAGRLSIEFTHPVRHQEKSITSRVWDFDKDLDGLVDIDKDEYDANSVIEG